MTTQKYPDYAETGIPWIGTIPDQWDLKPLKRVASVIPSNVDKHSQDNELPVHLCNYTDVYYRDCITSDLNFMRATASAGEIDRFQLAK